MKKIYMIPILGFFALAAITTACKSPQEKVTQAEENLDAANANLVEVIRDSTRDANWAQFKLESYAKIQDNQTRISQLKMTEGGTERTLTPASKTKIADLERKNTLLQERIDEHDKFYSNWETFKREWDHDMTELSKTLHEISADNNK